MTGPDQTGIAREYLTHALRILEDTGSWIVGRSSRELEIRRKQDRSVVTDVDLEVLVTEAGGKFVRFAGDDPEWWNVVFGKPAVVDWILDRFEMERGS